MRKKLSCICKKLLSAILAAGMMLTALPAMPETVMAESSFPTLTVDMTPDTERGLKHGGSGWLYGLGDEQVPTANTMTALKPHTAVQKAPNGMQHPNGDTLDVADTFIQAGGKDIQIYVPDYYALWFYEFSSTEEYLDILKMQAEECIKKGIAEDVVYVLYNEPYENWIGGSYTDPETGTVSKGWDSLFWFWEDMYNMVVDVYKENGIASKPRFAGLNLAWYQSSVMERYIKFCVEHSCMPDIVTWHDLSTDQYNNFDYEYNHYRSLEEKYLTPANQEKYGIDITPREIVINEYAEQKECASPGDLVRWLGLFEDYNVNGCLPFWHLSNNLNGLAADNNEGNGAWWLYKWYGDMSGNYLPVKTSNAAQCDYYGVASLDDNKRSASVVFGGVSGSSNIVLDDIVNTETFKDEKMVHVKVEATDYTGFHGVAEEPRVVKEGAVEIVNGQAVIPMSDMLDMSAYRITVTKATEMETVGFLSTTWKQKYEAEDGLFFGDAQTSAPDVTFACSGRNKVGWIQSENDGVEIQVNAPKDGYYKFDMVYCAANGCNTNDPDNNTPYTALQNLAIDGEQIEEMVLPTTLNWSMGGMYSTYVYLQAGSHSIRISGTTQVRSADVDCVYLTYQGPKETDTLFNKTWQAEQCEFNELSGSTTALRTERRENVDYVTGLEVRGVTEGGGLRFNAIVPDNGMYTLKLRYQAEADTTANIYQDNDAVTLDRLRAQLPLTRTEGTWENAYQTVFLQKGINVIDIDTKDAIYLDYINVAETDAEPVAVVEAESGALTGEGTVGDNSDVAAFASEGGYVKGLKAANGVEVINPDDTDFQVYGRGRAVDLGEAVDKNSLTISVTVPEAGEYAMAVYQSSGELFGKHSYNAQMTERYASFAVNGSEAQKVVFRNTYSDEVFRSQIVPVTLNKGENTIRVYNDNSKVVTNGLHKGGDKVPANIDYNVLVNYTPNFDRFEFYPVTADTDVQEKDILQITTASSEGGSVSADASGVQAGESVKLIFRPEKNAELVEATVNGESIMDKLHKFGGIYILADVQEDVTVRGIFKIMEVPQEPDEPVDPETTLLYSVNCGDINPSTLSEGDTFGTNNSVTEQFYGADPATGKMWGIVDEYAQNDNYADWLTGKKTWPCENQGVTDESPRGSSFRYARNQPTSDVGIVYQFELEANQSYDLEMGFYVPSSWTNAGNPRTMKLVLNDAVAEGYENFTASNDSGNPYVIRTTAVAGADGNLKIQIGHADNAVWGPVISYIDIREMPIQGDLSALQSLIAAAESMSEVDYSPITWTKLQAALTEAQVLADAGHSTQSDIDKAAKKLQEAMDNLVAGESYNKLQMLVETCAEEKQELTTAQDWNEFKNALANAEFMLKNERFREDDLNAAYERLNQAAEKLFHIDSIAIAGLPKKTQYVVGEAFEADGLKVEAKDSKGTVRELTEKEYTLSGYDLSVAGTVTITVTCLDKTAFFEVTVVDRPEPTPTEKPEPTPTEKPEPTPTEKPEPTPTKKPELTPTEKPGVTFEHKTHEGQTFFAGGLKYKVTKDEGSVREVRVTSIKNRKQKKLSIPKIVVNPKWKESFKVTSVKAKAFKGTAVTKAVIGANVIKIGPNAFANCKKLKSVVIGKKVKSIGIRAFFGCKNLKQITIKSTALRTVKKQAFKKISKKAVLKVPKKNRMKYRKLLKRRTEKGVKVK